MTIDNVIFDTLRLNPIWQWHQICECRSELTNAFPTLSFYLLLQNSRIFVVCDRHIFLYKKECNIANYVFPWRRKYVLPSVLYSQNVLSFGGEWLNVISFTWIREVQLSICRYSQNTHVFNSIRYRRNIQNLIQIGGWKFKVRIANPLLPSANDDFHCVDFYETRCHELNIYSCPFYWVSAKRTEMLKIWQYFIYSLKSGMSFVALIFAKFTFTQSN
jgi:hypothetical protein